jgi:hypothetical protein
MHEIRRLVAEDGARLQRIHDAWDELTITEQTNLVFIAEAMLAVAMQRGTDDDAVVRDPEAWRAVAAEGRKFA